MTPVPFATNLAFVKTVKIPDGTDFLLLCMLHREEEEKSQNLNTCSMWSSCWFLVVADGYVV